MKKSLCLIILVIAVISCKYSNESTEKEIYNEILPLLIEKYGNPTIPPLPPQSIKDLSIYVEKEKEHLIKTKKLGIYPIFSNSSLEIKDIDANENSIYYNLIKKHNLSKREIINIKKINNSKKNYAIVSVDTTLSSRNQYLTYYKQLSFSKPVINDKFNKALVTVSIKDSGMILCLLEKKQGNWGIMKTKSLLVY